MSTTPPGFKGIIGSGPGEGEDPVADDDVVREGGNGDKDLTVEAQGNPTKVTLKSGTGRSTPYSIAFSGGIVTTGNLNRRDEVVSQNQGTGFVIGGSDRWVGNGTATVKNNASEGSGNTLRVSINGEKRATLQPQEEQSFSPGQVNGGTGGNLPQILSGSIAGIPTPVVAAGGVGLGLLLLSQLSDSDEGVATIPRSLVRGGQ
jgi:hypothetical protein